MARRFNRIRKANLANTRAKNTVARRKRQHIAKLANLKTAVLNLSNYKLNDSEITLLAKGLKFIPSPRNHNASKNVLHDFTEFARKLRCRYHFHKPGDIEMHPLRENSGFEPDRAGVALETYIDKTKLELSSLCVHNYRQNITN